MKRWWMDIRVLLEYDPEAGAYSATCPELNFVSSCGDTREAAVEGLREAIRLLLMPIPDEMLGAEHPVETIRIAL